MMGHPTYNSVNPDSESSPLVSQLSYPINWGLTNVD
jgi:hypothetical protein